ncbi:MAG: hypothetical protein HY648_04050 [Acidobacteria bacterium]|nr:hypothetical protein [Acidobacteriota bacterium]
MKETTEKKAASDVAKPNGKKARMRSPAYPGINLETAIKRAHKFYEHEKRSAAPVSVALKHWGLKEKSSAGMVAIAALKSFRLINDSGSGDKRKIQLTEVGLRIILDQRQDSQERDLAIKNAALAPKIHSAIWKKWGASLPSDDNLRHALIFDWKFNENSVDDFIREYKDTIRFAKLSDSDSLSVGNGDTEEDQDMSADEPEAMFQTGNPKGQRPSAPLGSKEISMPVGVSDEGQAIFAHVRFDAPLRKDFLKSLRGLLEALEKGLA